MPEGEERSLPKYCPVCGAVLDATATCTGCGQVVRVLPRRKKVRKAVLWLVATVLTAVAFCFLFVVLSPDSPKPESTNGLIFVEKGANGTPVYVSVDVFEEYSEQMAELSRFYRKRSALETEKGNIYGDIEKERRIGRLIAETNNAIFELSERIMRMEQSAPNASPVSATNP